MNYLDVDGRYWAEHPDGTYWADASGGYLVEESAETLAANHGPLTEVEFIG